MKSKFEYFKIFKYHPVPEELQQLWDFENSVAKGQCYAECFELLADEENVLLKTFSSDQVFLDAFICFAEANCMGAFYAFWLKKGFYSLDQTPIVIFGRDGGYHVVSQNIRELLQILTYDVEALVDWDGVEYYKEEEDHQYSPFHKEFKAWLEDNFQLESLNKVEHIVKTAQEKHQEELNSWMSKYYSR